jgi:hypothetical protein
MPLDGENPERRRKSKLDDSDFLGIVASERRQSIGFEHDNELLAERERALNYFKGIMPDMPSLPNRSSAVSTDIADAIETVLPDLVEIFVGGDDVVTFTANSEQDEEAAKQETEYVRQVIFEQNPGFLILYSMFKDALQSKVGVATWRWEDNPIKPEDFRGKTAVEIAIMEQDGSIEDIEPDGTIQETGEPTYRFTLTKENPGGQCKIEACAPEDFTVGRDTVRLDNATYAAFRTRPRVQQLIEWGYDRDLCENLPPYGQTADEEIQLARDTAGEHAEQWNIVGNWNMRSVEIVDHTVRVDSDDDGITELWRVVTGGTETVILDIEEMDRIRYAAITPYIVTHRFYGESIADRLIQVQKIKTALLRMMLDSGYFALNQRVEVADDVRNEYTIGDLLRNEPGLPVRVKKAGGLNPISAGQINFDTFQAMEFVSTMSEQRTGIVRAAQGLNPDSLHDTAGGMTQMLQSAQMRMRLIARVFAETGIKDLYLGVHAMLRKHQHQASAQIGKKWIPIDCSQWGERNQMTIGIGLGSAGRVQELAAMQQVLSYQSEILKMQGGATGPLVTADNAYRALIRFGEKAGEKAVDEFFTDPTQTPSQQPQSPPGAAEAQQKAQSEQAALQQKAQQEAAELQAKTQSEAAKLAQEARAHDERIALDYAKAHDEDQRERLKIQNQDAREQMKLQAEMEIKRAEIEVKRAELVTRAQMDRAKLENVLQIAMITAKRAEDSDLIRAQAEAARASVDLELQARDHEHEVEQSAADNDAALDQAAAQPQPQGDDE